MLDIVGLTAVELQMYELLIGNGPMTASAVRSSSRLSPAQVRTGLRTLRRLGLVALEGDTPVRYSAVSPDLALGPLLLGVERQLTEARNQTERLAQHYRRAAADRQPRDLSRWCTAPRPSRAAPTR
jgi:sugar-specific transcriptional regulator TrmB